MIWLEINAILCLEGWRNFKCSQQLHTWRHNSSLIEFKDEQFLKGCQSWPLLIAKSIVRFGFKKGWKLFIDIVMTNCFCSVYYVSGIKGIWLVFMQISVFMLRKTWKRSHPTLRYSNLSIFRKFLMKFSCLAACTRLNKVDFVAVLNFRSKLIKSLRASRIYCTRSYREKHLSDPANWTKIINDVD